MSLPLLYNDLVPLFYALGGLRALGRLIKTWKSFWDTEVTSADRALAGELALFVLIPFGVFLHNAGQLLAIQLAGGHVIEFQWRVMWGFVVPDREFAAIPNW